jgi:Tfp pilus assembly protein PilN
MDKIYINLNPKAEKFDTFIFKQWSYYAALGSALILIIILILGLFTSLRLAQYNGQMKKWRGLEQNAKLLSEVKSQILQLEGERKGLDKVITPQNKIGSIFEDIFVSLPQNLWFDSLELKEDILILKGYVIKLDEDYLISLEKFINALRMREYFSSRFKKVNIKNSQKRDFNGVEVLEFNIECKS